MKVSGFGGGTVTTGASTVGAVAARVADGHAGLIGARRRLYSTTAAPAVWLTSVAPAGKLPRVGQQLAVQTRHISGGLASPTL